MRFVDLMVRVIMMLLLIVVEVLLNGFVSESVGCLGLMVYVMKVFDFMKWDVLMILSSWL